MKSIVPIVTINFNGRNDTLALVKSLNDSNESYYLVIVDNKSPKEGEFNSLKKDIESFYKKSFIDEKMFIFNGNLFNFRAKWSVIIFHFRPLFFNQVKCHFAFHFLSSVELSRSITFALQ